MVNVPGRSKGCNTCRRRKKGCDGQRPHCVRCLNDGQRCEGYDRPTIFVREGFSTKSQTSNYQDLGRITVKPRPKSPSDQIWSNASVLNQAALVIVQSSLEEGIQGAFWRGNLPANARLPKPGNPRLASYWWADEIISTSKLRPILRETLNAVYLTMVSSITGDPALANRGLQAYGLALARINVALQDPTRAARNDVLIPAISFLALVEKFNAFTDTPNMMQGQNWMTHVRGIIRLLLLRGPEKHKEGIAFLAYTRNRMPIFAVFWTMRKSCPFGSQAWCEIPWTGRKKTPQDLMFDILLKLPGVLETVDLAEAQDSTSLRVKALDDLLEANDSLTRWKEDLMTFLRKIDPINTADGYKLNDPLYFLSFGADIAHCIVTYWAVSVPICSTISVLQSKLPPPSTMPSSTTSSHSELDAVYDRLLESQQDLDPEPHAQAIMKSIPYFTHPDSGIMGFQNITFPIGMLLGYIMTSNARSASQIKTVIGTLTQASDSSLHGRLIGQFLAQILERGRQMQPHGIVNERDDTP